MHPTLSGGSSRQADTPVGFISPGDTCKVINWETYPITIGWGNVEYVLRPEEETFVPAEAVINYFGDSRASSAMQSLEMANGQRAWVLDRATEVRRLRIKWQALNMNNGELELTTPKVDVYTITGEWVPTVAADPEGTYTSPASTTKQDEMSRDQIIENMQAQLDILLRERNLSNSITPLEETEVPVDDPRITVSPPNPVQARAAFEED